MAAMTGDWASQDSERLSHSDGSHTDFEYLKKAAKVYYMMADAMLKVREEND